LFDDRKLLDEEPIVFSTIPFKTLILLKNCVSNVSAFGMTAIFNMSQMFVIRLKHKTDEMVTLIKL